MTTKYYRSFAGKSIPFRPVGEIDLAKAESSTSYYIATFQGDMIVAFERRVDGILEWHDTYTYHPESRKLSQRRMEKADGTIIVQGFDRRGRIIAQ